jgi:5-formyltetrahydrofolate cyclo-ligase
MTAGFESFSHGVVAAPFMGRPAPEGAPVRGSPRLDGAVRCSTAMTAFDRAPLRARRAALARSVRRDAAAAVAAQARALDALTDARAVAAYVPVRGELDPWPIIEACRARGALVHLPVVPLASGSDAVPAALEFAVLGDHASLTPGPFGIAAPPSDAPRVAAAALDVVLLPLVAFDDRGTRAGMGAGFYDRTFAFRAAEAPPPLLVGLAYHWQEVPRLDADPWDVPLDAVITDRALRRFR